MLRPPPDYARARPAPPTDIFVPSFQQPSAQIPEEICCVVCSKPTGVKGATVDFPGCMPDCSAAAHARCLATATWLNAKADMDSCPFCSNKLAMQAMAAVVPPISLPDTSRKPDTIAQGIDVMQLTGVVVHICKYLVETKKVGGTFGTLASSLYHILRPPINTSIKGVQVMNDIKTFLNHLNVEDVVASGIGMKQLRQVRFGEFACVSHFGVKDPGVFIRLEGAGYGQKEMQPHTEAWTAAANVLLRDAQDPHTLRDKVGLTGTYLARTGVDANVLVRDLSAEQLVLYRIDINMLLQMGLTRETFLRMGFGMATWKNYMQMGIHHAAMLGLYEKALEGQTLYTVETVVKGLTDSADEARRFGYAVIG